MGRSGIVSQPPVSSPATKSGLQWDLDCDSGTLTLLWSLSFKLGSLSFGRENKWSPRRQVSGFLQTVSDICPTCLVVHTAGWCYVQTLRSLWSPFHRSSLHSNSVCEDGLVRHIQWIQVNMFSGWYILMSPFFFAELLVAFRRVLPRYRCNTICDAALSSLTGQQSHVRSAARTEKCFTTSINTRS